MFTQGAAHLSHKSNLFPSHFHRLAAFYEKKCHPGPTPEPLLFSLCCVEIYSVLSELRNVWNDSRLLPKAERRGNKIICLPLHAHICAKKKKKKSASHPENGRTVASSEQEAMQKSLKGFHLTSNTLPLWPDTLGWWGSTLPV